MSVLIKRFSSFGLSTRGFHGSMSRSGHHWYPDQHYLKQRRQGKVIQPFLSSTGNLNVDYSELEDYTGISTSTWDIGGNPYIGIDGLIEKPKKHVATINMNFGPQHPAAHGVLRFPSVIFYTL